MAQRQSGYRRIPDEAYDTIAWPACALVNVIGADKLGRCWDSCDRGNGALVHTLRTLGIPAIGTKDDFLALTKPPADVDSLVTNPPYGEKKKGEMAVAFIERALALGVPFVAMLLRVDFDSAVTRQHLFRHCAMFAGKVVLLNRIKWFVGPNSPSDNHAWFCWSSSHAGAPNLRYVSRSEALVLRRCGDEK